MQKKRILSLLLAVTCAVSLLAGCGSQTDTSDGEKSSGEHEAITMSMPDRSMGAFVDLVHEKYPEINLEIIPYSGDNKSIYLASQLKVGDIPDIYISNIYSHGQEEVHKYLMDLSSYSFTNNYTEVRLRDVSEDGAIYLLPTFYSCIGISYNKTLLEQNGWELPTTFEELAALAPKVKEAGYNFALAQIQYPGYGFQYLCNILDTSFLNTFEGRQWQEDFLAGKATVAGTPEMVEALKTLDKWKEVGILVDSSDIANTDSDADVAAKMAEGNTLFMIGSQTLFDTDTEDKFGIMPYLSEDGTQNSLILQVANYVGLNKHLEDAGNEQKLEDALHVMEVLSTVEGMSALNEKYAKNSLLPLVDYEIPENNYYKELEAALNSGQTAPFIYAGWENIIVAVGETMIDYIKGNATLDDVVKAFDDNQHLIFDNSDAVYTTLTEKLSTEACAKLIGIAFGEASGADLSLVSINKWYPEGGELNKYGVSGELYALPLDDHQISTIIPTGWRGNVETVTLTGKRIRELTETGFILGENAYPYVLTTPEGMEIVDDQTYTVAICGVTDEVAAEGNLTDTGVLGMTAAADYLEQFDTLSSEDLIWRTDK